MKKVPVTIYENGERKIVGEAVVDIKDGYLDVTATIEPAYASKYLEETLKGVSLGDFSIQYSKE